MTGNVHILGIVNLTPDSFYAGSRVRPGEAVARIRQMLEEGADAVDLGACSTSPGSRQPSLEEEWDRLEPVLNRLSALGGNVCPGACPPPDEYRGRGPQPVPARARRDGRGRRSEATESPGQTLPPKALPLSIDTYRSEIVRRAYEVMGPFIVNDISGGQMDPQMLETAGRLGLPYIAMHMRGTPETMQGLTDYEDVVASVIDYFNEFAKKAEDAGIRQWIPDPGFGFSKTLDQNYELLHRLGEVVQAFPDREVLVGVSRKSMVYKALGITPEEAMPATQIIQFQALEKGARWLRVHDVKEAVTTARLYSTMYTSSPGAAK